MDRLLQELRAWGCDMDGVTARFFGDWELYTSCLKQAAADASFERLGDALRTQNAMAAFDEAHTLKGVLSNMGLTPLYDSVVPIVESLRAGETAGLTPYYEELLAGRAKLRSLLGEE
jgi:hypothetical protein